MAMEDIRDFLKTYQLREHKEVEKNFFQIAGFPHYENVSSNVLSFYFKKSDFVLKSFLNCISVDGEDESVDGEDKIEYIPSIDSVEDVIREDGTENRKRIDIVVYTNRYIIGIENKINAGLYNPIDDYYSYLKDKAKEKDKKPILIVLSKNKIELNIKYENILCKNILYKDFSTELKEYYPALLDSLGYKYFFFLTEYIANIEFLEGGSFMKIMNNEFFKIAKQDDNLAKIEDILKGVQSLRDDLADIARQIGNDLEEDHKSFEHSGIYQPNNGLYAAAVFQNCFLTDKTGKKYNFTIDVGVVVSEFVISIFERGGGKLKPEFRNILGEILPITEKYDLYNRDFPNRACYNDTIKLEEYDKLIEILKGIFKAFDKYIESKKSGT
jgi:hypothetical protein